MTQTVISGKRWCERWERFLSIHDTSPPTFVGHKSAFLFDSNDDAALLLSFSSFWPPHSSSSVLPIWSLLCLSVILCDSFHPLSRSEAVSFLPLPVSVGVTVTLYVFLTAFIPLFFTWSFLLKTCFPVGSLSFIPSLPLTLTSLGWVSSFFGRQRRHQSLCFFFLRCLQRQNEELIKEHTLFV